MLADPVAPFSRAARAALRSAVEAIRSHEPPRAGGCCCAAAAPLSRTLLTPNPVWPSGVAPRVELEDQDGNRVYYEDIFAGKPCVAVFFYTRCPNPNKCSLTITKLGHLQKAIADVGLGGQLRTVAVTYDPDFDVPARLRAY